MNEPATQEAVALTDLWTFLAKYALDLDEGRVDETARHRAWDEVGRLFLAWKQAGGGTGDWGLDTSGGE